MMMMQSEEAMSSIWNDALLAAAEEEGGIVKQKQQKEKGLTILLSKYDVDKNWSMDFKNGIINCHPIALVTDSVGIVYDINEMKAKEVLDFGGGGKKSVDKKSMEMMVCFGRDSSELIVARACLLQMHPTPFHASAPMKRSKSLYHGSDRFWGEQQVTAWNLDGVGDGAFKTHTFSPPPSLSQSSDPHFNISLNPNGKMMMISRHGINVRLYQFMTYNSSLPSEARYVSELTDVLVPFTSSVINLFSPHGHYMVIARGRSVTVRYNDFYRHERRLHLDAWNFFTIWTPPGFQVDRCTFSTNNNNNSRMDRYLSITGSSQVIIYDLVKMKPLCHLQHYDDLLKSPVECYVSDQTSSAGEDSLRIVTASRDGYLVYWSPDDHGEYKPIIWRFMGERTTYNYALSPCGDLIAAVFVIEDDKNSTLAMVTIHNLPHEDVLKSTKRQRGENEEEETEEAIPPAAPSAFTKKSRFVDV